MGMRIESRQLGDVVVLLSDVFRDERGFFSETFRADQFKELGLPHEFVQDNHSGSVKGVLRGLHFQWEPPMGKLMRVTRGAAFLVAVDIRKGSPTRSEEHTSELQSRLHLVCRLLLEKKKKNKTRTVYTISHTDHTHQ